MSVKVLLSRLSNVKPKGKKSWMACCPAHEDKSPSLAVTESDDGRILIHCFAGCSPSDVLESVGLEMAALFSDDFISRHRKLVHFEKSRATRQKSATIYPKARTSQRDEMIVALARSKRANGEKLTEREMDLELKAFLRLRGGNATTA